MKIVHEKENLMFGRKEVILKIESNIVPSQAEVKKAVSDKYSSDLKHIKIKKISAKYGTKDFLANVFIYKSEDDKGQIEIKKKKDHKSSGHEAKAEVKK